MRWLLVASLQLLLVPLQTLQVPTTNSHPPLTPNATDASHPVVELPSNGAVRGVLVTSRMGRNIGAFMAIPYAQPPLGKLRFQRPLPVTRHEGVLDATKAKPGCLQLDLKYSDLDVDNSDTKEDCLHLNVFVPRKSDSAEEYEDESEREVTKLPVFVFFYGGVYIWGETQLAVYDGVEFAAEADAVYVVVNYRLNVLGFLRSPDEKIPGNAGVWDMAMALQWVHDNIASFGGDPDLVTVGGQSAGAFSAATLAYSPITKGLFKRAFLMSGTSLSLKFLQRTPSDELFVTVSTELGCADDSDPVTCLISRNITQKDLKGIEDVLLMRFMNLVPSAVDPLLDHPADELHRNKYHVDDIMLGTVVREGDFFVNNFGLRMPFFSELIGQTRQAAIRLSMKIVFGIGIRDSAKLYKAYFPEAEEQEKGSSEEIIRKVSDIVGDCVFDCPTEIFAKHAAASGVNVRQYVYAHQPSVKINLNIGNDPTHIDDVPFILGSVNAVAENSFALGEKVPKALLEAQKRFSPEEHHFSRVIIRQIANFMRTGKPKIPGSEQEWPLYTKASPQIVYMAPNNFTVVKGPKSDKCGLWEPYIVSSPLIKDKDPLGLFLNSKNYTAWLPDLSRSSSPNNDKTTGSTLLSSPPGEMAPTTSAPGVTSTTTESINENVIRRGKVLRRTQHHNASDIVSAHYSILVLFCSVVYARLISLT